MSRRIIPFGGIWRVGAGMLVAAIFVAGCVNPAVLPEHLARPADATAKVPQTAYSNVTGQTQSFRPQGPRDWEELNRRVGPKQ